MGGGGVCGSAFPLSFSSFSQVVTSENRTLILGSADKASMF